MNCAEFIRKAEKRGIRLSVADGNIAYDAPVSVMTDDVVKYIRTHKSEIISEISSHKDASKLAVLLSLPDGFQFWLAPDGMEFDTGGIPVLRRSVMDEMEGSPDEIKKQLHTMVTALRELGGELSVSPETTIYPDAQKARSGSLAAPI